MPKTIIHFLTSDLKRHQHFIYQQMTEGKRYRSIVLLSKRISTQTTYPFSNLFHLPEIKNVQAFLKEQQVLAIHAHHGGDGVTILPLAQKYKIPVIVSFRGRDASAQGWIKLRNKRRYQQLSKKGALFLPVCHFLARELRQLGFPMRKIHTLYGGIDLQLHSYNQRQLPEDGEIRLLSVSRMAKKKGFRTLLRAFKKVHSHYPHTSLTIIGVEQNQPNLRKLINSLRLNGSVHLVGKKSRLEVAEEMQKAHIFCLASQTSKEGDLEGIPNVLKEAMACGLPVVSTRHAGIPELISHRKTGYLARERDHHGLASGIIYYLENPKQWNKITRRARRVIEDKFDLKKQLQEQERLYALVDSGVI